MSRLFTPVQQVDLRNVAAEQCLPRSWKVRFFTNITFYLDKLLGDGLIEDGWVGLPDYICKNNRYAVGMDPNNGQVFKENLCSFSCLTMRLDCLCNLGNTNEVSRRQRQCGSRV